MSICLISGTCLLGLLYFQHIRDHRRHDPKYHIVALVQTSSDKEGLKTAFLAELLELSIDNPKNLYAFSAKDAQTKLLNFPVIKRAKVNKIKPGIIWVDYSLRKPIAYLADYSNTFIDAETVPFPVKPFFTPKRLPEIFLGLSDDVSIDEDNADRNFHWGLPIQNKKSHLAFTIMEAVNRYCCTELTYLSRIDVSKAFAQSYGQRQIVVILEDLLEKEVNGQPILSVHPKILRLSTDKYLDQLKNYTALQVYLRQHDSSSSADPASLTHQPSPIVVDLRLPDLAFISKEN